MLSSAHKLGGRAFSVVVWVAGWMTVVAISCLWLISDADALARIIGSFMLAMGGIGTAYQAQNFAQGLPGVRDFKSEHRGHGQTRRASDPERMDEA